MLNPNSDRLDYGQVLSPPEKYKLDFAIGTTYSLDLDALVGACLALGLSQETDSDLIKNPICMLEALRSTGDKVALFCEGGQIHMPSKVTPLYILLEKMVFQVNTVKQRGIAAYPSFHPKFWLIRYVDDKGTALYRVVVLSRNLTFDRSWDVTFYMDGILSNKKTKSNTPVADFLTYLIRNLKEDDYAKDKEKRIKAMMRELQYVHFDTGCREFYDFEFIPNGIKDSTGGTHSIKNYPLFGDSFHEVLIMSPFISNDIIKDFNERNPYINHSEYLLITRAMSLARLKTQDCANFKIYSMKDAVIDGESAISEIEQQYQKQDIHAKVYMVRKNSDTDLYLGSLNASHNAVHGNIEFMFRLKSKNRYLNLAKLTEDLFNGEEGGANNPFQRVQLTDTVVEEAAEKNNLLEGIIKGINRLNPTAVARGNADLYEMAVHFGEFECVYNVTVKPLLSNKTAPLETDVLFSGLALTQLSEFYSITVDDGERKVQRVIIIPTEGLPEDREKAVVSSVVNDKACFYRYIAFLLGDSFVLSALEADVQVGSTERQTRKQTMQMPALYEKMLQTAATAPERFNEIDYLIKAISKDGIIPDYFEELYNTFRKAVKLNG